jgi:hypothetical protein
LKPFRLFAFLLFPLILSSQQTHPILAVGSPAPEFSLPGVDGKNTISNPSAPTPPAK